MFVSPWSHNAWVSYEARFIAELADPGVIPSLICLSVLQILFQVSVVVLVRPNHHQLQIVADLPIGKQVQCCFELEFMNEYASEVAFLFFPNGRILRDLFYFCIQSILFGFGHLLHLLLKRPGLVDLHNGLPKFVFRLFAFIQLIQSNQDFFY